MFMMPIPPTNSETAAMPASKRGKDVGRCTQRGEKIRRVANAKIVGLFLGQPVRMPERRGDLGHRVRQRGVAFSEREQIVQPIRLEETIAPCAERDEA